MDWTHKLPGIISDEQTSTASVSGAPSMKSENSRHIPPNMAPSMKSDWSRHTPPNMAEERRSVDSGYAPSQSSWSVSSGSVLCDVCNGPAVKRCLTCNDSYCGIHVKDHYTSPDLDSHELQDLHYYSICPQHHKRLKFYCRTDQSAICSDCFLYNHNGHDVIKQTPERTLSETIMKTGVPPPGPIQFVSVGTGSVTLRWSPPEGAPGHRTFKVTWTGGQKHCNLMVTATSIEVTELTPGEKYHFTVATLSQDGRQSTPVEEAVYTEVPPPQNFWVEVDLKSLSATVTWTKPAGVDQVTYLLEVIKKHGDKRTVQRNSCQYTITDLQPDAGYTINVTTAVNNGRQSKPVSKTFSTEVPPPQHLQVTAYFNTPIASATWTKPAGVDQVTYLLEIMRDQEDKRTFHTDSCQYTITGLQPDADYTINITTVVSNGRQSQPASKAFRTAPTRLQLMKKSYAQMFNFQS
ncbi:fibronectin-like [Engraulis encrasicolus]|uniref:fibronectin-like n=1 Tax=Engraulis encrasicolus TaxID=184585 RepID=UPI002FD5483B